MQDSKYTILCIDDDPDVLEMLQLILTAHSYNVVQAPCAEEGLKVLKETKPDLVFVDMMMEEIDAGTNFVRELKLLGVQVPVYMLSSMGDSLNMSTDYASLGLSGVLQKPITPAALIRLVKAKLE